MRENISSSRSVRVVGFINNSINSLGNGFNYDGNRPSSSNSKMRAIGLAATVNYNYAYRYYVDASYRLDGASSFGKNSRFAPYWSIGAGWTVSNEPLMQKYVADYVSLLRLRYSYGVSGSLAFSPSQSQSSYTYSAGGSNLNYMGSIAAIISALENPDLKWQYTYQHNMGIDLGLFQSRVGLSANYYYKLTDNSITDMALPLSNGFEKYVGNQGRIMNSGLDLNLSIVLLTKPSEQLHWSVTFGTSYNKNRVLTLSEAVKEAADNSFGSSRYNPNYYLLREGSSIDAIYALPTVGIDPSTGRLVYLYKDGTQSYEYDANETVVCGDRMPKLDGRLGMSFSWKGLSMYAGFTIRAGGQAYNSTYARKIENVNMRYNVDWRVYSERWKYPGDEAIFMGLTAREYAGVTDRYIQDDNTFECNQINVSYDFRQPWVKRLGFQRLTVTGSIGNVFHLSTIRQERGTSYPYSVQPTFGMSFSF